MLSSDSVSCTRCQNNARPIVCFSSTDSSSVHNFQNQLTALKWNHQPPSQTSSTKRTHRKRLIWLSFRWKTVWLIPFLLQFCLWIIFQLKNRVNCLKSIDEAINRRSTMTPLERNLFKASVSIQRFHSRPTNDNCLFSDYDHALCSLNDPRH